MRSSRSVQQRKGVRNELLFGDTVSLEDAGRILAVQMPFACKALPADSVINNSGYLTYTCLQVYHLVRYLRNSY